MELGQQYVTNFKGYRFTGPDQYMNDDDYINSGPCDSEARRLKRAEEINDMSKNPEEVCKFFMSFKG
jgi:hypothetical protein